MLPRNRGRGSVAWINLRLVWDGRFGVCHGIAWCVSAWAASGSVGSRVVLSRREGLGGLGQGCEIDRSFLDAGRERAGGRAYSCLSVGCLRPRIPFETEHEGNQATEGAQIQHMICYPRQK